jgi:peptidyl-prolyl cis-trans isomerase C
MKTMALFALAGALAWAQAPETDPVVLTVGNEKFTRSMFENIIATLNEQQRQALQDPKARRSLAEQIAELKMMAQEARARRLDQQTAVQTRIVLQAEQVLANAVYQEMLKVPPSEADLQAFYKDHADEFVEAKGRHILIRFEGSRVPPREGQPELTEEQALRKARDLRNKILSGAPFADVAKAESDDLGSGENGGDLGTFTRGQMVEEFDREAFAIPVGVVSEPIRTAFGYHLILIDERSAKPFEEVRDYIEQALRPQTGQRAIEALKAKTPISYNEAYFGTPE